VAFKKVTLAEVDLSAVQNFPKTCPDAGLRNASSDGVILRERIWLGCVSQICRWPRRFSTGANLGGASFEQVDLSGGEFGQADLKAFDFWKRTWRKLLSRERNLAKTVFRIANLSGANLAKCEL